MKPINYAAKEKVENLFSSEGNCDVCKWCDEPRDGCSSCDQEVCLGLPRDYD